MENCLKNARLFDRGQTGDMHGAHEIQNSLRSSPFLTEDLLTDHVHRLNEDSAFCIIALISFLRCSTFFKPLSILITMTSVQIHVEMPVTVASLINLT
ncbi:hypothetical protein P3T76_011500 [Phytophthora citrophthora]|uniref:Uncharacterized protein n=1 Tax=Phytophthora citrophthora TaxID=4793 RepID=A0AAD9LG14_9STRA|nr:hypothetical protein P3T76_011500 [Phytophthora citrophthora]